MNMPEGGGAKTSKRLIFTLVEGTWGVWGLGKVKFRSELDLFRLPLRLHLTPVKVSKNFFVCLNLQNPSFPTEETGGVPVSESLEMEALCPWLTHTSFDFTVLPEDGHQEVFCVGGTPGKC